MRASSQKRVKEEEVKVKTHKAVKARALENPEIKKEYDKLEPEFKKKRERLLRKTK